MGNCILLGYVHRILVKRNILPRFYGISHACAKSGAQAVFSLPRKKRPGNKARPFLRGRGKTAWAPLLAHARRSHKNMGIRARLYIVRLHISNIP